VVHSLLVSFNLGADIDKLFLVHLDELKVLFCDIVVVLFHLFESFLVVLHQIVDVLVLALFDFVNLNLHAELELFLQVLKLLLVVRNQLLLGSVKSKLQIFEARLKVLLLVFYRTDILHFVSFEVFLLILLLVPHLLLLMLMISMLLAHRSLGGACLTSNIVAV